MIVKGSILLTDFDACQRVFALIRRATLDMEFANPTWSFECGQRRNQEIDLCLRDVGTGICAPGLL